MPVRDLSISDTFLVPSAMYKSLSPFHPAKNKVYHAFLRTEMNEYLLVRLELFVADGVTVLNDGIDKTRRC